MEHKLVEIAAAVLRITPEEALQHCRKIDNMDAWYFWQPIRGGIAVIVDEKGEKLGATSVISFEHHLQAFLGGKRN